MQGLPDLEKAYDADAPRRAAAALAAHMVSNAGVVGAPNGISGRPGCEPLNILSCIVTKGTVLSN